jgi:hypothetical protein
MPTPKYRYVLAAISVAALLLGSWAQVAIAQSQADSTPSVAEAARRARELKKNAAKPVKTLTNDDLPAAPTAEATEANPKGAGATPDSTAAAPANDGSAKQPATANDEKTRQKKAEDAAALERAKKELATALEELDVMQRKAALDSDSYYSKTGFASDTAGKANLDAEAQQITDKKQTIEAIKARVAELQAAIGDQPAAQPDKNAPPR